MRNCIVRCLVHLDGLSTYEKYLFILCCWHKLVWLGLMTSYCCVVAICVFTSSEIVTPVNMYAVSVDILV